MPTDLTVRPADPSESDSLAAVYGRSRAAAAPGMPPGLHSPEEDRGWFAARLSDGEHEAWVAEREARVLGYALATETWLDHLFVEPDHQTEGVGGALLDVVKAVRPAGFLLWVFETNLPARTFYARRGLVELERTDGSGNEERAPDVKMAWPGLDPLSFYRGLIDDVDGALAELLSRRLALTRAVQDHKRDPARDADRERQIAEAMARVAPEIGADRLGRIMHLVIGELLNSAEEPRP